ncbi:MAG TPA: GlsB/YeaQ/YmgE family stress response membrane protein [Candidatus Dormibacteraeota bacterium]
MSHHWYIWILIGFIAGSLAGRLTGVRAGGCFMTTLVGIAGGLVGGAVISHYYADDAPGFIASTIVAFVFAAVFLGVLRALGVARPRADARVGRR